MSVDIVIEERMQTIRTIVADVLEIDPNDMTETSRFKEEHDADSLRALEILSRLESTFKIQIAQEQLVNMTHLATVYDVVKNSAAWSE